jgi:acetyl-CoA carboxylase biotin carboxylase subunit
MIAKVIVHARTRELAIARMRRALDAMVVEGIKTTIPLHVRIMDSADFQAGNFSTRFMEEFLNKEKVRAVPDAPSSLALTGASA